MQFPADKDIEPILANPRAHLVDAGRKLVYVEKKLGKGELGKGLPFPLEWIMTEEMNLFLIKIAKENPAFEYEEV